MPRVTLVANDPDYAPLFFRWRQEPSVLRHNPLLPRTLEDLREVMEVLGSDLSDRDYQAYLWFVQAEGELIGTVTLKEISWNMKYAEIGYGITEPFQRLGYGTEAVRQLVEMVFAETDLYRLQAVIAQRNRPSRRLVERLGFKKEGLLREHFLVGDRRVNEVLYALLRREWISGR
jgi:RimJ/RimL family protein N-acetyltransferase